jgi:hypothetical protein
MAIKRGAKVVVDYFGPNVQKSLAEIRNFAWKAANCKQAMKDTFSISGF